MKQLGYNDISLKPQKCIVNSRGECNTAIKFGNHVFDMPVYPANMKSVVDINTCKFLAKNYWFYTMHRFDIDVFNFIEEMRKENLFISISVGINQDSYDILRRIYNNFSGIVDYITIDVANAWSEKTQKMVNYINNFFPTTFLIVGNIATGEAIKDMEQWGDIGAFKVCIAPGSPCSTRHKTGVFRPPISTIQDCSNESTVPLIADGGIVEHGDIAKALSQNATMIMAGSLFAGYDQSAGKVISTEYHSYKEYYGSASRYNKKECKNIEGKKKLISYKGDMSDLLIELKEDLQSSISYVGGKCLKDLKNAEYYEI
jgi:GMP reductase